MKMALLIANRGFFPSTVIESARNEMCAAMRKAGIEPVLMPSDWTRYGAVETTNEGFRFAEFLDGCRGEYDGLIISLPNFGDENGIKAAIRDLNVPVLLQAYPDEIGKMDFEHRRDAFCGKLGLTSVLKQMDFKYTAFPPFVVHPETEAFHEQLVRFKAICTVVGRMRALRVGAVGARTTAFKSVRCDEMALEKHGIDVETLDMTNIFARIRQYDDKSPNVGTWLDKLHGTADFCNVPEGRDILMAKLGASLEDIVSEMRLDALAIRCWSELQQEFGITPCSVAGILNQAGVPVACEMDISNALPMLALSLASGCSSGCLDWNNNYGDHPDQCVLFHCGPLPLSLMQGPGIIEDHKMLSKSYGKGCSWGLNVGKMKLGAVTFASMRTENGVLQYYIDKGEIIDAPIDADFFGTSGVLKVDGLQEKMHNISEAGFRHHVTVTSGDVVAALDEAFGKYLGYRRVTL